MGDYWFDTTGLTERKRRSTKDALYSLLPGKNAIPEDDAALTSFAERNGLEYQDLLDGVEYTQRLPSLVVKGTRESMVIQRERPYFEIGNHGWRFYPGDGDGAPSRRGYIAVRHGLELPRTLIASRAGQAGTLLAAATTVINVTGMFDAGDEGERTAIQLFRAKSQHVKGLADSARGFDVFTQKEDVQAVTALLTSDVCVHLTELAKSFDLEFNGEWLFLYSSFGDLSTLDPEIWAWTFGAVSRAIDVLRLWGVDVHEAEALPWYTPESIPRPAKRDGMLRTAYGRAKQARQAKASTDPKPFLKRLASTDPHSAALARTLLKQQWQLHTLWGPEQMDAWQLELAHDGFIVRFGIERGTSSGVQVAHASLGDEEPTFRLLAPAVIGWARETGADEALTDPNWQALTLIMHGAAALDWLRASNDEKFIRICDAWNSEWMFQDLPPLERTARWVELIEAAAR